MRRRSGIGAAAAVIAACIFGAALLTSLVMGAGVFRQVQDRTERAAARRVGLSYLTTKLHAHDAAGTVRLGSFGDGDALFLTEEADDVVCETVIYVHGGSLMELYRVSGSEMAPDAGQIITDARLLTAEAEGPLIRLSLTDGSGYQETVDVFMRSGT